MTSHSCEAQWVVGGAEQVCGKESTGRLMFEGKLLYVCRECGADLHNFQLYRINLAADPELVEAKAALESWVGSQKP
jgi:hypothetical protein